MDIANLSMALSQTKVLDNVGVAMLKNSMEMNEDAGDGILKLLDSAAMELSVNPAVGGSFDVSV